LNVRELWTRLADQLEVGAADAWDAHAIEIGRHSVRLANVTAQLQGVGHDALSESARRQLEAERVEHEHWLAADQARILKEARELQRAAEERRRSKTEVEQ
jgi:hypothetical protein